MQYSLPRIACALQRPPSARMPEQRLIAYTPPPASFANSATALFTLLPSSSVLPSVDYRQMFATADKKERASRCEVPEAFGLGESGFENVLAVVAEDETLEGGAHAPASSLDGSSVPASRGCSSSSGA